MLGEPRLVHKQARLRRIADLGVDAARHVRRHRPGVPARVRQELLEVQYCRASSDPSWRRACFSEKKHFPKKLFFC